MPNQSEHRSDPDLGKAEAGKITPEIHHNYVAFFLTLKCNLKCAYCINLHGDVSRLRTGNRNRLSADQWIAAANRLVLREDLPLTLQGGEPTLHKGFYRIVNEVKPEIKMDLMTNMMFDVHAFVREVPVWRFHRKAPYAPIRVSYHPGQNRIEDLISKTHLLQDAGFRVGLYGIMHPDKAIAMHIRQVQEKCQNQGIDFRVKEFLGFYQDKLYGNFKYNGSVMSELRRHCRCRTTELLVDPAGDIFRCHADLYQSRPPVAHILDPDYSEKAIDCFRTCAYFGECNPCDVKVKTNRHQVFGHTSVEIENIQLPNITAPVTIPNHCSQRRSNARL